MSIKSIALIAATLVATAGVASADNSFGFGDRLDASSTVDLGTVRATGPGIVEIYDHHDGSLGRLLGTETVNAGANFDVRVNVGARNDRDVIAVLKVDGQVVATRDYDID